MITGCDTGFGHGAASRLANRNDGFVVFASVLQPNGAGANALRATDAAKEGRLFVVALDVTKQSSVDAAFNEVRAYVDANVESRYFHSVVNNAGVQMGALFEWTSVANYKTMIEVNYIGMIRVTKGAIPLLLRNCCAFTALLWKTPNY